MQAGATLPDPDSVFITPPFDMTALAVLRPRGSSALCAGRRGPLNADDGDIASLVAQMPVDDATS